MVFVRLQECSDSLSQCRIVTADLPQVGLARLARVNLASDFEDRLVVYVRCTHIETLPARLMCALQVSVQNLAVISPTKKPISRKKTRKF